MDYLQNYLHIDYVIVLLVLVSGFFQNRFLTNINLVKDSRLNSAYLTLIVSLVACAIYLTLISPAKDKYSLYFISYFVATSLYELLIKPFTNWIKKITNDDNAKQ